MKRFLALLLVIALFLVLPSSVSAATADPVQPRFAYINSTYVNLTIEESSGTANCYAVCTADQGVVVKIVGTLQRYEGMGWSDVRSWTLFCMQAAVMDKQWSVDSGYLYKFSVRFEIYNSMDTLLETHTSSDTYYYPAP